VEDTSSTESKKEQSDNIKKNTGEDGINITKRKSISRRKKCQHGQMLLKGQPRRELKVPLDLETRRSFVDLGNSKFSGAMEAIVRMQ
jgi:hypothetical protein